MRPNESVLEYIARKRVASNEVVRRYAYWLSRYKRTDEAQRNSARQRIALEVHEEFELVL